MLNTGLPFRNSAAALAFGTGLFAIGEARAAGSEAIDRLNANFLSSAGFVEDDGASEHMVFAAKLRLLSQRIPAAACFEHFGIEPEVNAELLNTATAYFDRILDGLEHGDAELGLMKPETDPHILRDIASIHAQWDPIHELIWKIASGDSTDAEIISLSETGTELVKLTSKLSSDIMAEYSDPTLLLQSDALKLEIAGRMPMMAQRMAKDLCMAIGGLKADEMKTEMAETRVLFENTANALQNGMPALGLTATDDPEIQAALSVAMEQWASVAPSFDRLVAGEVISKEEETLIYHKMHALTDQLDAIEMMFSAASKMNL